MSIFRRKPGQMHSAAADATVGPWLWLGDRMSGKSPAFHWDTGRQEYVTKDGRTMDEVRRDNERRG